MGQSHHLPLHKKNLRRGRGSVQGAGPLPPGLTAQGAHGGAGGLGWGGSGPAAHFPSPEHHTPVHPTSSARCGAAAQLCSVQGTRGSWGAEPPVARGAKAARGIRAAEGAWEQRTAAVGRAGAWGNLAGPGVIFLLSRRPTKGSRVNLPPGVRGGLQLQAGLAQGLPRGLPWSLPPRAPHSGTRLGAWRGRRAFSLAVLSQPLF